MTDAGRPRIHRARHAIMLASAALTPGTCMLLYGPCMHIYIYTYRYMFCTSPFCRDREVERERVRGRASEKESAGFKGVGKIMTLASTYLQSCLGWRLLSARRDRSPEARGKQRSGILTGNPVHPPFLVPCAVGRT